MNKSTESHTRTFTLLSNLELQDEYQIKKMAGFSVYIEDLKPFLQDLDRQIGVQSMGYAFSHEGNLKNKVKKLRDKYPNSSVEEVKGEGQIVIDTKKIDEFDAIFINEGSTLTTDGEFIASVKFGENKNVVYNADKDGISEINSDLEGEEKKKYQEIENKYLKLKI